jgi:hypothetical protein
MPEPADEAAQTHERVISHARSYVGRPICARCRVDWPCPDVAAERERVGR